MPIHRLQSVYLILEIKRQRWFFQASHPQFRAGLHMRSTAGSLRQVRDNEKSRRLPKGKNRGVCLTDEKNETACIRNMQPPSYQTFQFTLFVRFVVFFVSQTPTRILSHQHGDATSFCIPRTDFELCNNDTRHTLSSPFLKNIKKFLCRGNNRLFVILLLEKGKICCPKCAHSCVL